MLVATILKCDNFRDIRNDSFIQFLKIVLIYNLFSTFNDNTICKHARFTYHYQAIIIPAYLPLSGLRVINEEYDSLVSVKVRIIMVIRDK